MHVIKWQHHVSLSRNDKCLLRMGHINLKVVVIRTMQTGDISSNKRIVKGRTYNDSVPSQLFDHEKWSCYVTRNIIVVNV